jgi:hypothetical protein
MKEEETAGASMSGQTRGSMKVYISITYAMEMALSPGRMVRATLENGKGVRSTEKESTLTQTRPR